MSVTCDRCDATHLLAHLTLLDGDLVCQPCVIEIIDHRRPRRPIQRPAVMPAHGLEVVDVPRGMAGRLAAMRASTR